MLASGVERSKLDTIVLGGNSIVTTENREVEIKLRVEGDLDYIRQRIESVGLKISKPRVFESNIVYDTAEKKLRGASELIRLRRVGPICILTYKGPPMPGKYKAREEIETEVSNAANMELVLARLGFAPGFRYEKFRTEYQADDQGNVTLDETPIGTYIELEGDAGWIDRMADQLGYSEHDYITKSYGSVYLDYCRERGIVPSNMVFA